MGNYHSTIVGKGEPLLFLPAAGFSGIEGLNIANDLKDYYECHMLDLPGWGKSKGISGRVTSKKIADWVLKYIEGCGFEKVCVVGHSMGGGLSLCFAWHYPDRVKQLVLLDVGHKRFPFFPVREIGLSGLAIPAVSVLELTIGEPFVKKIAKFFMPSDEEKTTEADRERAYHSFCKKYRLKPNAYIRKAVMEDVSLSNEGVRLMLSYYRLNLPKMLNRITVPTLLICSTFSGIDAKEAKYTNKALRKIALNPHLHLYKIDTHHYVHWSETECLNLIESFMSLENDALRVSQ